MGTPVEDHLGAPFVIQGPAIGAFHQHRGKLALMVERKNAKPGITSGRNGDARSHDYPGCRPYGLVQRVAPDRSLSVSARFVAHKPEK